jgi:hypothetical protein
MPNLFSYVPVVILACVPASMLGFTRTATGATFPSRPARRSMRSSSGSLSTLKEYTPWRSANSISASVLPTPAKTQRVGSPPGRDDAAQFAPADDVEAAALRLARVRRTARLEFALTAKQTNRSSGARAWSSLRK